MKSFSFLISIDKADKFQNSLCPPKTFHKAEPVLSASVRDSNNLNLLTLTDQACETGGNPYRHRYVLGLACNSQSSASSSTIQIICLAMPLDGLNQDLQRWDEVGKSIWKAAELSSNPKWLKKDKLPYASSKTHSKQ